MTHHLASSLNTTTDGSVLRVSKGAFQMDRDHSLISSSHQVLTQLTRPDLLFAMKTLIWNYNSTSKFMEVAYSLLTEHSQTADQCRIYCMVCALRFQSHHARRNFLLLVDAGEWSLVSNAPPGCNQLFQFPTAEGVLLTKSGLSFLQAPLNSVNNMVKSGDVMLDGAAILTSHWMVLPSTTSTCWLEKKLLLESLSFTRMKRTQRQLFTQCTHHKVSACIATLS